MKITCVLLLIALMAASGTSVAASSGSCLEAVQDDLSKKWPDNKTINIVAFGHSVPAGYFATPEVHSREAYPRLIADGLAASYPTAVVNVITSAVAGENSGRGLQRFKGEALGHLPRVVTIDYGLNDRVLTIEQSRKNLAEMIRESKKADVCVVLVTPTIDLSGDFPAAKSTLLGQVEMIQALGGAEGVPVADAFDAFKSYRGNSKDLMAQSNHPNAKGHQLVADRILSLLR
ncbi:SGNH/GDSL hydrolase family protein [Xanthomonas arboricola]|uniref:SGNH/GDSL hydrolase family protein n=1 Tax=Xanthomonas arboricola TaxID=56448 RepID=UPI0014300A5B|nr:SGNH/GDSL hydrolase family protein [Xanthomonas arboricola]NJB94929.1 lysophospholipase L1-like esterase [Xanthomonas arboricola]